MTAPARMRPASAAPTTLPWRPHLRICLLALRSGWWGRLCGLAFPLMLLLLTDDPSGLKRVLCIIVLVSATAWTRTTLSTRELRVFGLGAGEERRHVLVAGALSLVLSELTVGLIALVIALTQGGRGVDIGIAAGLVALVTVGDTVVRLRGSARPGVAEQARIDRRDRESGRPEDAAAPDGHRLVLRNLVRRAWWALAAAGLAVVPVQLVARGLLPDRTARAVILLAGVAVSQIVVVAVAANLADGLTGWLVFGGRRHDWATAVLRGAVVVPVAGVVGALTAVLLELLVAGRWGLMDEAALLHPKDVAGTVQLGLAGLATGMVLVGGTVLAALVVQVAPGAVQVAVWFLGGFLVAGLVVWAWSPGLAGWPDHDLTWLTVGPVAVVVVVVAVTSGACRVLLGRTAVAEGGGFREWFGLAPDDDQKWNML